MEEETYIPDPDLTEAERFFFEHSGWSYKPGEETSCEGRNRCARLSAQAEAWARADGVTFRWEDDNELWEPEPYDTIEWCAAGREVTCKACGHTEWETLASLGGIADATPEYRRVIEAELAYEAMP